MRSEYTMLETATLQHIISVVFWPGGTHEFFDVPADAFYNDVVPLEQVWGAEAPRLRDRLRDAPTPAEKFQAIKRRCSAADRSGGSCTPRCGTRWGASGATRTSAACAR